jgi:ABC-type branched-subunit amino acid transport system ATPase component
MIAAVSIDSLAKVFGGLRAVDGVSLQVAPGERRALIGPNGAGKTTLFHCVTGTLQPSSGVAVRHRCHLSAGTPAQTRWVAFQITTSLLICRRSRTSRRHHGTDREVVVAATVHS